VCSTELGSNGTKENPASPFCYRKSAANSFKYGKHVFR
jgi:hypothetical protein